MTSSTVITTEYSIEYRIRCSLCVYRDVLVIAASEQFNQLSPPLCLKWLHVRAVALSRSRRYVLHRSVARLLCIATDRNTRNEVPNVSVGSTPEINRIGKVCQRRNFVAPRNSRDAICNKPFHRNKLNYQ